jgi:hypothetical protein
MPLQKRIKSGNADDKEVRKTSEVPMPGLRAHLFDADGFDNEVVRDPGAPPTTQTGQGCAEGPYPH